MKIKDLPKEIQNNLEFYKYVSRKEHLRKNNIPRYKIKGKIYYFHNSCSICKEPFLSRRPNAMRCERSCGFKGKGNPFYGKHHSYETRKRISKNRSGKLCGEDSPTKRPDVRKKISESKKKEKHFYYGKKGKDTSNWKGGYFSKGIPVFDTYAHQISWCEPVRRSPEDHNILEVKCAYCGKWLVPTMVSIWNRKYCTEGQGKGEHRFYCSENCKTLCPIYNQRTKYKFQEGTNSREVQPELRQLVFKRDNWTCQKCGQEGGGLQCHHVHPVALDPLESADMDNCITLCVDCHKETHKIPGCGYGDLANCINI